MLAIFCPISCKAYDDETASKVQEYREEIDHSLDGAYSDDTKETLEEYKITADNPSAASGIRISEILSSLWQQFLSALTEPMRL